MVSRAARRRAWACLTFLLLGATPASAQAIYGQADWVVDYARTEYGGTRGFTQLFTQAYMAGYRSPLWDPRVGDVLAEATYYNSKIKTTETNGDSNNWGYNLGANLFPQRPFALSVNATRATGATSSQYPFYDFGSSGVALPPGYVPDRYSTKLSTFELTWQLVLPSWPTLHVNYRKDSGSTATGPYKGTNTNSNLTVSAEKSWQKVRNDFLYTAYSGEFRGGLPLDRTQKEGLYTLSADFTDRLRANARAGVRDVWSSFVFSSEPSTPGLTPPVLTDDLESFYTSGGVTYQSTERLAVDANAGYERMTFQRNQRDAWTDSTYAIANARYRLFDGFQVLGNATMALRGEQLEGVVRNGTQRGVGAGASYSAKWGFLSPSIGLFRGLGWTETVTGEEGNLDSWTGRAGLAATFGQALMLGADYSDEQGTDTIFSLGNYHRRRGQVNGHWRPASRLRADGNWERTRLDQGLGADRLLNDYRYGQAGVTWMLTRNQSLSGRGGLWKIRSGSSLTDTTYVLASYVGTWRVIRVRLDGIRDNVTTQSTALATRTERVVYRVRGYIETRLRLFLLGVDYQYSNNTETGLARYLDNRIRVRISRRFGSPIQG